MNAFRHGCTAAIMAASKKYRKYGLALFAGLAAGALIGNICLKNLIARSRPCWQEAVPLLIQNFPSDVLASVAIGISIGTGTVLLSSRIAESKKLQSS